MPLLLIFFGLKRGGSNYFFQEGGYSKTVLRKGREGLNFESQGVNTLLSPFTILTASPRFARVRFPDVRWKGF
jgi:hypothetical protein